MPPSTIRIVAGSRGIWPEANMKPFALIACEYGPMACGARSVCMLSILMIFRLVSSDRDCESRAGFYSKRLTVKRRPAALDRHEYRFTAFFQIDVRVNGTRMRRIRRIITGKN